MYAFVLEAPTDGKVKIRSLAESADQNLPEFHGIVDLVEILGYTGDLSWTKDASGLNISCPELDSNFPIVCKITMK